MNAEFFSAIRDLEREKGIKAEYMFEKITQALITAYRRDYPESANAVEVEIDEAKNKIRMYLKKTVVAEVENPETELLPEEAEKFSPGCGIGDVIQIDIETKKFGRIAAQTAKQVIIQGIREAERGMVFNEFTSKENEILTGVISRIEPKTGNALIRVSSNAEITEAVLTAGERVRSEELTEGDRIKVYVLEVRRSTHGPQVVVSRTHPGLVKRLFELEVPEIFDGVVEVKGIAREAGSRTKLAVWSTDAEIDPIGACVGPRGGRVSAIVEELRGERIDIIKYSEDPAEYIAASLAPSEVLSVQLLDEGKSCCVTVPDSQLSLAIGKEGQNARLAAKLTGYKIDIKPLSQMQ